MVCAVPSSASFFDDELMTIGGMTATVWSRPRLDTAAVGATLFGRADADGLCCIAIGVGHIGRLGW